MNEIQNSPKTPLTFATAAEVVNDIAVGLGLTIAVWGWESSDHIT